MSKMSPDSWCDVCCNLSLDIAREAELMPGFKRRHQNGGYNASLSKTAYQIDCECQFIKESTSSGCEFCKFLGEVIDTFIPNQTSHGDSMLLYLGEDKTYVYFNPSNPNTIRGRVNFQGVVDIYRPTGMI